MKLTSASLYNQQAVVKNFFHPIDYFLETRRYESGIFDIDPFRIIDFGLVRYCIRFTVRHGEEEQIMMVVHPFSLRLILGNEVRIDIDRIIENWR